MALPWRTAGYLETDVTESFIISGGSQQLPHAAPDLASRTEEHELVLLFW
jgi:hypothetical protein